MTIRWLSVQMAAAFHRVSLANFGGPEGIRDEHLLQSALARPQNKAAYGKPDLFDLAAAYCTGIIKNHPFVDGNKRTGLLCATVFLDLNGQELQAEETEIVIMIQGHAAGDFSEEDIANWLRQRSKPAS